MPRISVAARLEDLPEPLERIIERAARNGERLVLRRHGNAVALVVPSGGDQGLRDASWEQSRAVLVEASRRFADIPWPELEGRVAETVAEVRLEAWRTRESSEFAELLPVPHATD